MKLSVIIPTLNETVFLPATLAALRENSGGSRICEVIVVDSGSTDGTQNIAEEFGAKVIQLYRSPLGKAFALNVGAAEATGDIYLFLDADTILPQGFEESIEAALSPKDVVAGAFEFALDGKGFGLRMVEIINRIRYRIWKRYYGDQGIFVRACVFNDLGGYPRARLMEASDFCVSLGRVGKLALIQTPVLTSPRRFVDGGVYKVFAKDIKLWLLNILGFDIERYADEYWEENETRS